MGWGSLVGGWLLAVLTLAGELGVGREARGYSIVLAGSTHVFSKVPSKITARNTIKRARKLSSPNTHIYSLILLCLA